MDSKRLHIEVAEERLFKALCAAYSKCPGPEGGGCACTGGCLGSKLACLRSLTDHALGDTGEGWWSDQLHGYLLRRPHDPGHAGHALTAENYYPEGDSRGAPERGPHVVDHAPIRVSKPG